MFENTTHRMPMFVGLGLVGLVVVVVAGALLVMGVGGGNRSGAASPTATINSTGAFSPAATITPAATVSQTNPFSSIATPNPRGRFTQTGSMATAREGQTATLLFDGRVLIAGGHSDTSVLDSAELYDPTTGTFLQTDSMTTARAGQTATLLPDGRILIAGGSARSFRSLASAELYDPRTRTFSPTGSMATARSGHTATLLSDGRVLIAGGEDDAGGAKGPPDVTVFGSAELYDPTTGIFSPTGSMATARALHAGTLLSDGRVLIAGGEDGTQGPEGVLSSAELYDPATGRFSPTGSMATRRRGAATQLSDGRILFVGGVLLGAGSGPVHSAELYDQSTGTFSLTGSMAHVNPSATLLSDGRVLIAGGVSMSVGGQFLGMLLDAELFDPAAGTFGPTGWILSARENQTATLLADGRVLLAGGDDGDRALLASAELYTP